MDGIEACELIRDHHPETRVMMLTTFDLHDYVHVDAACLYLVNSPERFDVMVTDNLFGDIVTDLGAQLQGGLGMAASANVHPGKAAMFEDLARNLEAPHALGMTTVVDASGALTGVFTDGGSVPNPGPGGWGAVYVVDGDRELF